MQHRLSLWKEDAGPEVGPVWEELSPGPFHRFEKGDVIFLIHSQPKEDGQDFVVSRVEYGFQGLGPARELVQNVYFKVDVGGAAN